MMRAAYLDITCGIAGDMFLAALIDAGCEMEPLQEMLARLPIRDEFQLTARRVRRGALMGTHLEVRTTPLNAPGHTHEHTHGAVREHPHEHDRSHEHDHPHGHAHEHTDEHPHEHEHEHEHEHRDDHAHEHSRDHAHGRAYSEIVQLIQESRLPEEVQQNAIAVFTAIGNVEARLHGESIETIHFHEVGALDSIVDIVGVCAALHLLGVEEVYSSVVTDGHGTLACAHGIMPVPAPAALELLKGIPINSCDIPHELVTPTGAGLLRHFCRGFGPRPGMVVERIGYGAGTKEFPQRPNLLRVTIGERLDGAKA